MKGERTLDTGKIGSLSRPDHRENTAMALCSSYYTYFHGHCNCRRMLPTSPRGE
jgi:hypothetical protein